MNNKNVLGFTTFISIIVCIVLAGSACLLNLAFEFVFVIFAILFSFLGLLFYINYRFNKLENK